MIERLAKLLSRLPGIGPRHANRLAFYLATRSKKETAELAEAILGLAKLKTCAECFASHEETTAICSICGDKKRNQKLVAIVERETDRMSLEKTRAFTGRYLIIGALPKDGVLTSEHKQRLAVLLKAAPEEVIIALSPTTYGDANAESIVKELEKASIKITRLGRGIPTGGEVEFADEETLKNALQNRG